jgi:hypothetical protein
LIWCIAACLFSIAAFGRSSNDAKNFRNYKTEYEGPKRGRYARGGIFLLRVGEAVASENAAAIDD